MKTIRSFLSHIRISEYYYILVCLGYAVTPVFALMRPGVFAAALMLLIAAELFLRRELSVHTLPDIMAVCFFAYQVLSVIWLRLGG